MKRTISAVAIATLLVAPFAFAEEPTRWVNVHVTEHVEGTNVEIHLPLNLVLAVLKNVDVDNFHRGHVDLEIDDVDINWPEILAAVKEAPDGEFVTVDSPEAKVNIRKQGGTLLIDVNEIEGDNAKVKVTVPMEFMDALSINQESQIDVAALLSSFDKLPDGELVTVESDEANVRVWIE
jgi:hypothetical protein